METLTKEYSNGEITIVWRPDQCIHSTLCWKGPEGLLSVFNPRERPWIHADGADTERIIRQIERCPSGALSYYHNETKVSDAAPVMEAENIVEVLPDGPLMVYGNLTVRDANGVATRKNKVTAFCRCGASANKPYCDGSHIRAGFKG